MTDNTYRELTIGEFIKEGDAYFSGTFWFPADVHSIGSKYNPGSNPGQHSKHRRKVTMHYRNGREAKNGDKVVQLQLSEGVVINLGVLFDAKPGNDYCNGYIAPIQPTPAGACICDCLHVDDLAAILAEKGLDKRPAGK